LIYLKRFKTELINLETKITLSSTVVICHQICKLLRRFN